MPINSYENYPLTWRPDKTKLTRPIYKSLIQQLEEDILAGKLQKNIRLPSQRELADYLDINFTTVGQAYKYGIEQGLLYTNVGSGTYISQNALDSITISTEGVAGHIIDLGLVSSFEECNQLVLPFLNMVSQMPNMPGLLGYQEPSGTAFQLSIAAKWLKTQGVFATEEMIAVVSGVQNGLALALTALFAPGSRIAIDRYTYANFIELAALLHIELVPIDYDEEGMLPDFLLSECRKKDIQGVFVMTSCNNPIGFQISLERRKELAAVFEKEGLWIIEDDIHSFLTTYHQQKVIPPFQAFLPEQTLYLAGMTKFLCSGLRVAYLVFPKKVRQLIQRSLFNINVKTSSFDTEVITQLLQSPVSQQILEKKAFLTEEANQLFDQLFELPRPSNPLPYYRNIPVRSEFTHTRIEEDFLQHGVRVYHSDRFTTQKQTDPFIRLALSSNELEILETGLQRVKEILPRYI
ncbi:MULTISPECIES: PLP-dependent aminotransferase family protein [unclassified Enterococcus]|jgi:DNA-binding transcriptional MocR family regulator|uniref:aminotransferase-like domain-containing protein n=1 Tax=unclassified Enterococcus TaxID=2608891 RepID=UPI003D298153